MLSTDCHRVKSTVLVVDDSQEMRRYLRLLLETDSYMVETASDGIEALERVRNGSVPSLVLLDMQMPGMNGLETLCSLRTLCPELKVIMCSAVDDPSKINQAVSLGAQGYLVKPIQYLYLSAAIERCLTGQRVLPSGQALPANVVPMRSPARHYEN